MTEPEQPFGPAGEPDPFAPPPGPVPGQPGQQGQPWYGPAPQPGFGPPPGYPPPYQYGYPYGYPPPRSGANGMAIAAMVCGLCGFLCLVPGVVGIILGIVSLPQIKRSQQSGRGMAITGIVVGSLWIVLFVLLVALGHSSGSVGSSGTGDGSGTSM